MLRLSEPPTEQLPADAHETARMSASWPGFSRAAPGSRHCAVPHAFHLRRDEDQLVEREVRVVRDVRPARQAVPRRRAGQDRDRGAVGAERGHAGQRLRRAPGGAVLDADGGLAGCGGPAQDAVARVRAGDLGRVHAVGDGLRAGPGAVAGLGRDERRLGVGRVGGLAHGQAAPRRQAGDEVDGGVAARVQRGRARHLLGRMPAAADLAGDPGLAVAGLVGVGAARGAVAPAAQATSFRAAFWPTLSAAIPGTGTAAVQWPLDAAACAVLDASAVAAFAAAAAAPAASARQAAAAITAVPLRFTFPPCDNHQS